MRTEQGGEINGAHECAPYFSGIKPRADEAAKEAEEAEAKAEEETSPALREFNNARRYAGKGVTRSTSKPAAKGRSALDGIGGAVANVVIKELKGTTGRRIVRGILGGLFKGR